MALNCESISSHCAPIEKWLSAVTEDDDIVPWIWEFSFIYKPGGFNLDGVMCEEGNDLGAQFEETSSNDGQLKKVAQTVHGSFDQQGSRITLKIIARASCADLVLYPSSVTTVDGEYVDTSRGNSRKRDTKELPRCESWSGNTVVMDRPPVSILYNDLRRQKIPEDPGKHPCELQAPSPRASSEATRQTEDPGLGRARSPRSRIFQELFGLSRVILQGNPHPTITHSPKPLSSHQSKDTGLCTRIISKLRDRMNSCHDSLYRKAKVLKKPRPSAEEYQEPTNTREKNWVNRAKNCFSRFSSKGVNGPNKKRRHQPTRHEQTVPSCNSLPLQQDLDSSSAIYRSSSTASTSYFISSQMSDPIGSSVDLSEPYLESNNQTMPPESQLLQCTFCLAPFTTREDWMQHEQRDHSQGQIVPKSRGGEEDLFWKCGFCGQVLRSWSERQQHISEEHLDNGMNMAFWDPFIPPRPWKRGSITHARELNGWDLTALQGSIRAIHGSADHNFSQKMCQICQSPMKNQETFNAHLDMWHRPRSIWSCSALTTSLKPSDLFETSYDDDGLTEEFCCLCCGMSLPPNPEDPDLRAQHLEEEHNFDEHSCNQTSSIREQFHSHLASRHHVGVDYVQDIMKCCKRKHAPALMAKL